MGKPEMDPEFLNRITFEPLTKENWNKFVKLFDDRGACGNCWCMYYRLTAKDFREGQKNGRNKKAIKKIVWENKPAGILAIYNNDAVGWCAFAPREDFIRLERSRVHKRIDDKKVWSVPCFFTSKNFRRSGITGILLREVIRYGKDNGIMIIEAYPGIPAKGKIPDSFAWFGLLGPFERAGFEIADRTSKNRPMVRYYTEKGIADAPR